MEFNLSPTFLVNAGGGFLFVLEGLAILAIGGRTRRSLLVGVTAAFFGLTFVADNVLFRGDQVRLILVLALAAPTVLLVGSLAADLASGLPRAARMSIASYAVLQAAILAWSFQAIDPVGHDLFAFVALAAALGVLVFTAGLRARHGRSSALSLLALAFGLFACFAQVLTLAVVGVTASVAGQWSILAVCTLTVAGIIPWGWGPSPPAHGVVFVALVGAAVVGLGMVPLFFTDTSEFGLFGIMRTVGAFALALAVIKYDLLGVPLPHVVVKRGVVAGAALAILFIVAQVAQNFLSAQYGLLGGGVIAGAFLFAASPVQRAMERKQEGRPAKGSDNRAEASYRKAVEWALRDGKLNRDEEGHLHELAHNLGITGVRAHAILVDVERGG